MCVCLYCVIFCDLRGSSLSLYLFLLSLFQVFDSDLTTCCFFELMYVFCLVPAFAAEALHKDIKATFSRAPAAADAYVSTEVRWNDLERLFQNPKEPW